MEEQQTRLAAYRFTLECYSLGAGLVPPRIINGCNFTVGCTMSSRAPGTLIPSSPYMQGLI